LAQLPSRVDLSMARILIPDSFVLTLVTAARALGRRGDVCEVAWDYGAFKRLFCSRYVRKVHRVSSLSDSPEQFARDVLALCRSGRFDFVLPVSIESTEALLPFEAEINKHAATLLPTDEQLAIGANKDRTYQTCDSLDIDHPPTWLIRNRSQLENFRPRCPYPVIVKHARNLGGSRGVRFAGDDQELLDSFTELQGIGSHEGPILVQDYVPGHLYDAVAVAKNGRCPGVFVSVRKLMYPVSGGVTCISVSTQAPELQALASRLIHALNWNGPIEIEFKRDERDGRFKLIEINPRFWASLDSSVRAGINFPAVAADLALGLPIESPIRFNGGERHKFIVDRVPYAYWQLIKTAGIRALRDPQSYRRTTYDIDLRDPMPDVFSLLQMVKNLLIGKRPRPLTKGAKQMINPMDFTVPYV
jgi:predicted ATP-grasp superfamily ATP-dependent carboligase